MFAKWILSPSQKGCGLELWKMKLDALKSCWYRMFQVAHPEAGIPTDELSLEHGKQSFRWCVASVSFRWLWRLRQRSHQDIHIKQLARHTVQHIQHLEMGNLGHVVTKKHCQVRFGAFRAYKVSRCSRCSRCRWEDETSMESMESLWADLTTRHTRHTRRRQQPTGKCFSFNTKIRGQCSLATNSPTGTCAESWRHQNSDLWWHDSSSFLCRYQNIIDAFEVQRINCRNQRCNLHPFDSCWKSYS